MCLESEMSDFYHLITLIVIIINIMIDSETLLIQNVNQLKYDG